MKVAVITPYYKESHAVLERCMNSVHNQTHTNVVHYMIADGHPSDDVVKSQYVACGKKAIHVVIPNSNDYGDTPRGIGAALAVNAGFDAICFLDADCWYENDHIETALSCLKDNTPIVTIPRKFRFLTGEYLGEDDADSDGSRFNDTNCYLIGSRAYEILSGWLFKNKKYGIIGDQIFWSRINKQFVTRSPKATVNYPTKFAVHYLARGIKPPEGTVNSFAGEDGLPKHTPYHQS
jgi:glycosyltransferase involved in cell wall biosynthesis